MVEYKAVFPPFSISPIFSLPLLLIVSAQTNKSSRLKNKEREREKEGGEEGGKGNAVPCLRGWKDGWMEGMDGMGRMEKCT